MVGFDQILRYFTGQNGPKGGPHENKFWVFSNSEVNITVRSEKVDEKNGVNCLVSQFPSWVMVLKLSKKVRFWQFCVDVSKKSYLIDLSNLKLTLSPSMVKNMKSCWKLKNNPFLNQRGEEKNYSLKTDKFFDLEEDVWIAQNILKAYSGIFRHFFSAYLQTVLESSIKLTVN